MATDYVEDVVQDVLLTIHRARRTYNPNRSFTAWLRTIAERRAIDLLRRIGRQQAREVSSPLDLNPLRTGALSRPMPALSPPVV